MNWKNGEYSPKQKRAEEKKAAVLDAALDLFSKKGFHGTTTKEIAARAKVSTGSFYRYFKDKKAIFLGVCARVEQRVMSDIIDSSLTGPDPARDPGAALEGLIRFAVESHRRHRLFHREVMAMQIIDPDVAEMGRMRDKRIRGHLARLMAPMGPALRVKDMDTAVTLTHLAIEETAHMAVIHDTAQDPKRLMDGLADMLKRYLLR